MNNADKKKLILLGAGGHASVLADILLSQGRVICGVVSPGQKTTKHIFSGIPILSSDEDVLKIEPSEVKLVNGIGVLPGSSARKTVNEFFLSKGYDFERVISDCAFVSQYAQLSQGVQILRGAIVQAGACIGRDSIINTRAIIEHDSCVGVYCHVAPNATLCGNVEVGDEVFIGAGSTIIQGIRISDHSVVGAGATIRHDCINLGAAYT